MRKTRRETGKGKTEGLISEGERKTKATSSVYLIQSSRHSNSDTLKAPSILALYRSRKSYYGMNVFRRGKAHA